MEIVVGLTGPNAAGKGEAASYLARAGFTLHSLSDIVREEAAARDLPPERAHLIRIGNVLRAEGGPGVLARRILGRLRGRDVVDSIRNPAEVEVLRSLDHFVLIGIGAPMESRFRRSLLRGRPGDPESLEDFRSRELQENSSDPAAQQLQSTFAMADHVVENDGPLVQLHCRLDRLLQTVANRRPPVDS